MEYCLHFSCPDQRGIVAEATRLIAQAGGNLVDLSQHTVLQHARFMLRAVFDGLESPPDFTALSVRFKGEHHLYVRGRRQRAAILASRTSHCLYEMLHKHADGELNCDIACVISNHPGLEKAAGYFGVPFYHESVEQGMEKQEGRVREILKGEKADFVVLARYMRVLSAGFVRDWRHKVINIHHGFLPAFQGARPYQQAWEKGVKIIGATAHFAEVELDQGPIIAQDTLHVLDSDSADDLAEKGKDLERRVLIQAVKLYLDHRIFVDQNRTFIL